MSLGSRKRGKLLAGGSRPPPWPATGSLQQGQDWIFSRSRNRLLLRTKREETRGIKHRRSTCFVEKLVTRRRNTACILRGSRVGHSTSAVVHYYCSLIATSATETPTYHHHVGSCGISPPLCQCVDNDQQSRARLECNFCTLLHTKSASQPSTPEG